MEITSKSVIFRSAGEESDRFLKIIAGKLKLDVDKAKFNDWIEFPLMAHYSDHELLETTGDHSFELRVMDRDLRRDTSHKVCSLFLDWESRECWLNVPDLAHWREILSTLGAELPF